MDVMHAATLPAGFTVTKAIALWEASHGARPVTSETHIADRALMAGGEFHGHMPLHNYRRPRAPKTRDFEA